MNTWKSFAVYSTLAVFTLSLFFIRIATVGLSTFALAGPSAEAQTSAEQVKLCNDGMQQCAAGDQQACHVASKTCVGESRMKVIEMMASGG